MVWVVPLLIWETTVLHDAKHMAERDVSQGTCMASYIPIPAVTDPPGELMNSLMSCKAQARLSHQLGCSNGTVHIQHR